MTGGVSNLEALGGFNNYCLEVLSTPGDGRCQMDFHGLSDDQIFEKVAGESALIRFDGLMHMGMNRPFDKIDEAISFYRSAFELAKAEGLIENAFIAVRFWVNALRLAGRYDEALELLEAELSEEEAAKVSDDEIGRAMLEMAHTLAEKGETEAAIKKLEDAEPFLTGGDANCSMAEFYNRVSDSCYNRQRYQMSANLSQRARTYAAECGHTEVAGKSLFLAGRAYEAMRMFDDALMCYKEADTLLSYASYGDDELWARVSMARIWWLRKDFDKALDKLSFLRETARDLPYASRELTPRIDLEMARNLFKKGELQKAASRYFKARSLLRAMNKDVWAAVAEAEGALVQLALGNIDDAISSAESGLRWFNENPCFETELWVRLAYGQVMNATGNHGAALAGLSSPLAKELNSDFEPHVQYRIELAVAEGASGDPHAAAATAGVVLEFFDHALSFGDRGRLQVVMTEAAVARNDLPEALRCIALAIQNHAADFNSFEVQRLTERLTQIAAGEANRRNNEVIEGL